MSLRSDEVVSVPGDDDIGHTIVEPELQMQMQRVRNIQIIQYESPYPLDKSLEGDNRLLSLEVAIVANVTACMINLGHIIEPRE